MRNRYVLGFIFSGTMQQVLLMKKERPTWQKGFLNGIGGRCHVGEDPEVAMHRETDEEIGVNSVPWHLALTFEGPDYIVYVYGACDHMAYEFATPQTDEQLVYLGITELARPAVLWDAQHLVPLVHRAIAERLKLRDVTVSDTLALAPDAENPTAP